MEPELKLPILYLIDSIVKNVGGVYIKYFSQSIVKIFIGVFEKVIIVKWIFKCQQTLDWRLCASHLRFVCVLCVICVFFSSIFIYLVVDFNWFSVCFIFFSFFLQNNRNLGEWGYSQKNVCIAANMEWCFSTAQTLHTRCQSQPNRSALANIVAENLASNSCKSEFLFHNGASSIYSQIWPDCQFTNKCLTLSLLLTCSLSLF